MKNLVLKNSTNAIVLALVALGAVLIKGNCYYLWDEVEMPEELR